MAILKRTVWLTAKNAGEFEYWNGLIPPRYTLSRLDDVTFALDCADFASMDGADFYEKITRLLERLTQLAHLFQPGGVRGLSIREVAVTEQDGKTHHDATIYFRVLRPPAPELSHGDESGQTLLSQLTVAAETDEEVNRALRLLRETEVNWPAIYDVIEFLRGHRIPEGWISTTALKRYKRTANYYRHMGGEKETLPEAPPTLDDAQQTIIGLLRRWLRERVV